MMHIAGAYHPEAFSVGREGGDTAYIERRRLQQSSHRHTLMFFRVTKLSQVVGVYAPTPLCLPHTITNIINASYDAYVFSRSAHTSSMNYPHSSYTISYIYLYRYIGTIYMPPLYLVLAVYGLPIFPSLPLPPLNPPTFGILPCLLTPPLVLFPLTPRLPNAAVCGLSPLTPLLP